MPAIVADNRLFGDLFATAEMRALFSDEATVARYLAVEAALARAEAVMMALAPALGRQRAHDVVHDCCRRAREQCAPLMEVLATEPAVAKVLDRERLEDLFDPANHLGAAPKMIRRLLAAGKR